MLAASYPDSRVLSIVKKHGLPRYTLKSITKPADFLAAVRRVRRQGYSISMEETVPGSFSVAAPINSPDGNLAAVLVAARPLKGLSKTHIDQFISSVVETAGKISAEHTHH